MSVNKVFLLGNLGADPELRYTSSQTPVCTLRVATGDRRKNAEGEWVEVTEWHSVVVWQRQAENCAQYLKKGRQVFIEGRIQTRKWADRDGNDRYTTEVVAQNVQFIGGRDNAPSYSEDPGAGAPPRAESFSSSAESSVTFDDDDIPF